MRALSGSIKVYCLLNIVTETELVTYEQSSLQFFSQILKLISSRTTAYIRNPLSATR